MQSERLIPDGAFQVDVGGVGVEVVHHPVPGAPTIVFLHEGLGAISLWRDYPHQLARQTGCGHLVYSRPGYGGSDPVPLPRPLTYMHEEGEQGLPALLDALKVTDPILYGHSDGGSIALVAAGSGAVQARGLILEAPHVFCEDVSVEAITRANHAWQTTALRTKLQRHHGENVDVAFRGWADAWLNPAFRNWNIGPYLPGVTAPTLLIQGRDDPYGTLAQIERIAQQVSGPRETLILDDCGHSPHREKVIDVMARAAAFIAALRAGQRG